MTKVLVIGSGGREHALAWRLAKSEGVEKVWVAPGNAGTAADCRLENLPITDIEALRDWALSHQIDLTVVGPEAPLSKGVVNVFRAAGLPIFGPTKEAAQLESSKDFAKAFMKRKGIPTADYESFTDAQAAHDYVSAKGAPIVIKADGLAAGKGVVVAMTEEQAHAAIDDMLSGHKFGSAGARVVIEEFLEGEEASFIVMVDGKNVLPLATSQDHKRLLDGDQGPNTGGMGAYSPAPVLPQEQYAATAELVIRPILKHLAAQGHPFKGVLYAGLMFTAQGPMVLEYNVRFGDPECQPLLMRLDGDLLDVLLACVEGRLTPDMVAVKPETALCVVIAAPGYPGSYPKGLEITGLDEADAIPGVKVFQAGTKVESSGADGGRTVTSGGRVLGVTGLGATLAEAKAKAYEGVAKVGFTGCYFRRDIGDKGIARIKK